MRSKEARGSWEREREIKLSDRVICMMPTATKENHHLFSRQTFRRRGSMTFSFTHLWQATVPPIFRSLFHEMASNRKSFSSTNGRAQEKLRWAIFIFPKVI